MKKNKIRRRAKAKLMHLTKNRKSLKSVSVTSRTINKTNLGPKLIKPKETLSKALI
jgi:hypothetical protein